MRSELSANKLLWIGESYATSNKTIEILLSLLINFDAWLLNKMH